MSTFQKVSRQQTRGTPPAAASSFVRPSHAIAPAPTPASEMERADAWAQLERAARFGHSFERISLFPPDTSRAVTSPAVIQRFAYGNQVVGKFDATWPPTGDYPPEFYDKKFFGREFKMIADFNPDRVGQVGGKFYKTGEYRQYVKGYFKAGSQYLESKLGKDGPLLSKSTWNEDGYKDGTKYGYRTRADSHGKYMDRGASGSHYEAIDYPSLNVDKDETVEMSLDFRGELIVTNEKSVKAGPVLESREWSMKGTCIRHKNDTATISPLEQTKKGTQTRAGNGTQERASLSSPTMHKTENTGLPDKLKAGIEDLSGVTMDDVKVHYSSPRPTQLQALAYTQGADIYLGPGQEKHLPHEAWHVVQQKQGRVRPTLESSGVAINDDKELEREADAFGERVLSRNVLQGVLNSSVRKPLSQAVVQLTKITDLKTFFNNNEDKLKTLAAGYYAAYAGVEIGSAESANTILQSGILGEDYLAGGKWKTLDIDDKLVGLISQFPEFYVPTTAKIWKELIERIRRSGGQLKVPEKIDLSKQEADEGVDAARKKILETLTRKFSEKKISPLTEDEVKLYDKIAKARITVNFPIDKLFNYTSPQILNAFELRKKVGKKSSNIEGDLEQQRLEAEERHFGVAQGEQNPRLRPRYAALNFKQHPAGATARNDYGMSYMVLADAVKKNCTITIGDSFDVDPEAKYGTVFSFTHDGITALVKESFANKYANASIFSEGIYTSGDSYLEVQIHQDIDLRQDVDEILVSKLEMSLFQLDLKIVQQLIENLTAGAFGLIA